ncbi:MAG: thermonuclease family protein [Rhodobacteraceae bacterium]|nr:thermonuclease family protein [Paracoccaceae bacterium]
MRFGLLIAAAALGLVGCNEPEVTAELTVLNLPNMIAGIPSDEIPHCAITRIVDGDTITMVCDGFDGNVRLTGFDTPETYEPGCASERALGERAKRYLEQLLIEAEFIIPEFQGQGRYGRPLVGLTLDGVPLEQTMVAAGLAAPYSGQTRPDWCAVLANR